MRADAAANRAKIIAAASDLFAEKGFGLDVREICERAGVGMGTLYRHFPTKEDLILAVQAEVIGALDNILDEGEIAPRTRTQEDILRIFFAYGERYGRVAPAILRRVREVEGQGEPPPWILEMRKRGIDVWKHFQAQGIARDDMPAEFLIEVFDHILEAYIGLRRTWSKDQVEEWLLKVAASAMAPPAKPGGAVSEAKPAPTARKGDRR